MITETTDIRFADWKEANSFAYELVDMGYSDIKIVEYPAWPRRAKTWTVVTLSHPEEDTVLIQNTARTRPILKVITYQS